MLAHQREALGIVQQGREIDQIDGCHDGGGSSHEPVTYSRFRLQARPPSAPRPGPDPTTLKDDKSQLTNPGLGGVSFGSSIRRRLAKICRR